MKIEVSNGEIVDKMSILKIKLERIKKKYEEVTKPLKHYEELFNKKLNEKLNNGD